MKFVRKIITLIISLTLFLFGTTVILYAYFLSPVSSSSEEKNIEIVQGTNSREIGNILYQNNLIKNKTFFLVYLKVNNIKDLKAGTYKLNSNMPLKKIVESLKDGDVVDNSIKITFKEGINYRELARTIEKNTRDRKSVV